MASTTNTQFAVAVHVLTYLAGANGSGPVSSDELAGSTNTNPVYVRRVLGPLREAGFVTARVGSGGGWELGRTPDAIRLLDLWDALNGHDAVLGIHEPNPQCPVGANVQRVLVDLDDAAAGAVREVIGRHTVQDVLDEALHGRSLERPGAAAS